jgi:hypothetical protein
MAKQRYELEIEDILRKCEEDISRERITTASYHRPPAETGTYLADTATLYKVDSAREEDYLPPTRRLTTGQRTALAWLAFIVSLVLYPYAPLLTGLLIMVPIVLAIAALRDSSRNSAKIRIQEPEMRCLT